MPPKSCLAFMAAACLFLAVGPASNAQTSVTTDPVGFATVSCLTNSDTYVGIPFTRSASFVGTVASATGSVITLSGTPGLTANQFVQTLPSQTDTFFALIGTGTTTNSNEGRTYVITGNGTSSVTVNLAGDTISSIAAGTPISIIPYWTLDTVFPAANANVSFTPSAAVFSLKTQILIPDYVDSGINLAPTGSYYYITSGTNVGWRSSADSVLNPHGTDPLVGNGFFIVRNRNNAPTLPLTFVGSVLTKKITTPLTTQTTSKQDNFVSILRPVDVPLSSIGLSGTDGTFTASANAFSIKDQILLYDNTLTALNKAPSMAYYFVTSGTNVGWRTTSDSILNPHDSDTIPLGSAVVIRKAQTAGGATSFWTNAPTY